jgi:hypothetical protein
MNTDRADTHLDLEDLIAKAAGQPIADRAREHLATCEQCQLEANRWNLVADGVRDLAAAVRPAADSAGDPARPRRTGQRVLAGPWRRALLVAGSVAAAFVLLVGIGAATGYVHISGSGHSTGTTLTAVTGCTQLEQTTGTLAQVHATSLVIRTASGQLVTVTTAPSTFVAMSGPQLGDISDGASVTVLGPSSNGTIAARSVSIGNPAQQHPHAPGAVAAKGTVSDASTAGFTVITSAGTRVPVTTSSGTIVTVLDASLAQLQAGATVFALGQAGPDGTLSARAVVAVRQLPSGARVNVSYRSCSPSSIAEALALGG